MNHNLELIISDTLKKIGIEFNDEIYVEVPAKSENGDFSTNIAMKLAKDLKKSPMIIAADIVKELVDPQIVKIEIKSPGFINFFVDKSYLKNNIDNVISQGEKYGSSNIGDGKKVNIEFVSANPTGVLHLGNARGGSYGDSLARIMNFSGFEVTKEYYVNDAGNQINNLGKSIQARYKELCGIKEKMPDDGYFGSEIKEIATEIYNKYKDSYLDKDLDYYKDLGTKKFLDRIVNVLSKFRIDYDVFTSEKSIYQKYPLPGIIQKLNDANATYKKDGALWFKSTEYGDDKDRVLVKADGNYTYMVPDIPYHMDKLSRGFEKIIDILGTDHHGYVARLKGALKAIGEESDKVNIKLLQLVRLVADGKEIKMSKRTGNAVTLDELIDEVGINAARYYFVMRSLDTQMDFDLSLAKKKSSENPVYYVSYAYARICTILKDYDELNVSNYETINEPLALTLLEKVSKFPDVVKEAAIKELPHLITNYVYDLANAFHSYYSKCRIINDDATYTNDRLRMILAVKITLNNALNLIGVIPPEKM